MENFNLLNLPNSEKLVAILDGELLQNDAGNFFQELSQSQDLQEQFFDLVQMKNNLKTGFLTPPSNLRNNIMKGVGLAAASTLTYQSIATNQFSLWQNVISTFNSKIAIGLFSALFSGLITFGIMDYKGNEKLSSENSNSNLTQNNNSQPNNIAPNSKMNMFDKNKLDSTNNTKNIIPITKSNNLTSANNNNNNNNNNSSNTSNIFNKKQKNRKNTQNTRNNQNTRNIENSKFADNSNNNNSLDLSLNNSNSNSNSNSKSSFNSNSNNDLNDYDNSDFTPSNLIPGKVPESHYKVEKRSYKNPNTELNKLDTKYNNLDNQNLNQSTENQSNLKSNTIYPNPASPAQTPYIATDSDLDFELDRSMNNKADKNKYIDEESNLSVMFRSFNSTTIQQIDAPQLNDPIINNLSAGLLFDLNNHWSIGVEIGQENFEQEFKATNDKSSINVQQNYLAFWGGLVARYYFNPSLQKENFRPYVNVLVGSTDIGPLVKPSLGVAYNISNNFSLFAAGEYTNLYSKYNSVWYNSSKYGLTYGFIMRF